MSDKATLVECWRASAGQGFYLRLPGQQRAGKPYRTFDELVKAAIDSGVSLPFAWLFRNPDDVPNDQLPVTRSREGMK